ncbi:MAG: hypothetical protein Fur0023_06830 [Bacteroidia bacterium]
MNNEVKIILNHISKKFHQYYLYKDICIDIESKDKLVITGNNGSGKSTLLKIIAGHTSPSSGNIQYFLNAQELPKIQWHQYISIAAPYMSVMEEFSFREIIHHLTVFRQFQTDIREISDLSELDIHLHKPVKYFSSGMKQRIRLLIAILDAAPVLLLDEPCSNLDAASIQWYEKMIKQFAMHKTVIVFSNSQPHEYFFCNKHFSLSQ